MALTAVEAVEQPVQILGRDARAGIRDRNLDRPRLRSTGADPDLTTVRNSVLQSVIHEVAQSPLEGKGFHEATFKLVLVGVFDEYTLQDVEVGESGTFSIELEISADVRAGQYQVVALNDGGERQAALDISVSAAAEAVQADHDEAGGHEAAMEAGPSAEEMIIERSMAGAGWGVIGLLIGLSGGLGTVLLRRTPATEA